MKPQIESLGLAQARPAYRRAVQLCLESFFGKSRQQAQSLVESWWEELKKDPIYKSGIFLHDEPLNTAADLAHADQPPKDVQFRYENIIKNSLPRSRKKHAAEREQMIHVA